MRTVEVTAINYDDDSIIKPSEDEKFMYQINSPFLEIWYKGQLRELVNISCIRSMDVASPPRKCKWCQATTTTNPCHKCEK